MLWAWLLLLLLLGWGLLWLRLCVLLLLLLLFSSVFSEEFVVVIDQLHRHSLLLLLTTLFHLYFLFLFFNIFLNILLRLAALLCFPVLILASLRDLVEKLKMYIVLRVPILLNIDRLPLRLQNPHQFLDLIDSVLLGLILVHIRQRL